ncbi:MULTISPECIES: response regulator transcription factor [Flavobacteriaceae]|uniref:response regulator transcription factor n=1 Tax=Flavobacteriaceae TaxID=49546 RepID=UPI00149096FB|nr:MULTISPECIES: response regulator transcription factor [Allomuricauda]MDC6364903.1 response regulator transcription factor [Muricauda sp. AC10]
MKTDPLKIAIIDSDVSLHLTYEAFFEDTLDYELCGIFKSVHEQLSHFGRTSPDVIISEISLPGLSGIDGISHLRKRNESVHILVMSQNNNFAQIKEAFKKGANGYLVKPLTAERLFNALDALQEHGLALEHEIVKKIVSSFRTKSFESFSKKENQIIELLTQGFTYKMIADRLCVTPSAVNFHIQNIYVKLNVNSKSEALEKLREMEMRRLNAA